MLTTSLYLLRKWNACETHYHVLVGALGPKWTDREVLPLARILETNSHSHRGAGRGVATGRMVGEGNAGGAAMNEWCKAGMKERAGSGWHLVEANERLDDAVRAAEEGE